MITKEEKSDEKSLINQLDYNLNKNVIIIMHAHTHNEWPLMSERARVIAIEG